MKSQTRKVLLLLAEAFFYCLGGVALFQILWFFIQDLFSTDHAFLYFLPYYLSCLLPAYLVVILHKIRHPTSEIGKKRWMKVNSFGLGGISLALLILDIVYLSTGTYGSILLHQAGPLFPLSNLIFLGLTLLFAIGFFLFTLPRFFHFEESEVLPKKRFGTLESVLVGASFPFACGFLGDFLLFPSLMDYSGQNAFLTFPVYLLMLFPSLCLLMREIFRDFLSKDQRYKATLPTLFVEGVLGLVLVLWMCIGLSCNGDFIIVSMTAHFPIDFMGSMMLGPYFLFFLGLLYPGLSTLFYLLRPASEE